MSNAREQENRLPGASARERERIPVPERARAADEWRDHVLAMLAHELRTPLQVLEMGNELMRRRVEDEQSNMPPRPWWVAQLEKSRRTITRISQLMETILGMSQVTSGGGLDIVTEPVDLRELVHQIVKRDQQELDWAGCVCSVEAAVAETGHWDRGRLDLVVSNLLSNAAKYGRGKPICIRLDGSEAAVTLSVTDNGPGIPPELHERLFQRWSRLPGSPRVGGLGLGLWITHEIVRAMEGEVRVKSVPGQGATFIVELPRGG